MNDFKFEKTSKTKNSSEKKFRKSFKIQGLQLTEFEKKKKSGVSPDFS